MSSIFDTIILGAGPGGYELAAMLACQGERVALLDPGEVGGTCLNRGCIPTKTLCHAAEAISAARDNSRYGISVADISLDWATLQARKDEVVATLRQGIEATLKDVTIFHSRGRLTSDGSVITDDNELLEADRIVIATGSLPSLPPIPGVEFGLTSNQLLSLDSLPASIIIIGGGVIGLEFASIFCALGVEVTVIEAMKEILPPFDRTIAKRLRSMLSQRGIKFMVDSKVASISADGTVEFESKGKIKSLTAEKVAVAVGRKPNFPEGLSEAGVEFDNRGIKVNDQFATTAPGIYAIGDVNGICQLAHAATAQARIVAGLPSNLGVIPSAVFTLPEAAMVGLTEEICIEKGLSYKVSQKLYGVNGKAMSMGAERGMVKIIYDSQSDLILGVHIVGAHAADLANTAALAMANDLTHEDVEATIFAHPTLTELLY